MRMLALVVASTVALAAGSPEPQKIVFARVFPNAGQMGLFIAAADGSDERLLLGAPGIDYDPVWAPDGASIVFTSDREGSADLFRVKPDGTGLERLTTSPAYDDQAAFSPDGKQLVFVTTRNGGTADLWTMDLQTRRGKALTSGSGGDFRPAWSPDGRWIAFSSDRGSTVPFGHGRWERLQIADLYVIHPDGTGMKRITEHGGFCGSPQFSADSRSVLTYCMTAEQTLANRQPHPEAGNDTRLVSIDLATGKASDIPAGPGVKLHPSFLPANDIGYVRKDSADAGIYYTSGKRGPAGDVRTAAWSPDGRRVAFHRRLTAAPTTWLKTFSRNPQYELTLTGILPSFNAAGDRFVMTGRPTSTLGATLLIAKTGANAADVLYQDKNRNVMAPSWSPGGDKIIFGIGVHNLFFNFFNGLVLEPADRTEGGAQIAMINPDGTGFHEVTSGASNSGFPSMAPDGKRFVYRSFGPDGQGLRIMNLETKAVTTLTEGYDNFPLWSPRGDLIMFSRQAQGAYEIYTIKPDGTGVKRLTFAKGNEAHQGWSPDGESIVFATSRMGFKDEASYTDGPQPYGELFVMRYDGTNVQQLTDNQWEDGTPAWQPRISAQGDALVGTAAYLVSYVEVTPSSRSTAVAALTAYREASRKDDGYIRVELFEQIGRSGHFAIVETWRDQKAVDAHGAATQKHLLDALQPIRVSGYDERAYKALSVGPAPPASNSRQIWVVSHVDVTPDSMPAALLRQLAERSRQEAGNVRFDVVQHTMRANHFTVVETWQSQQAFDAHVAAAHTRQFRDELQPFTGSPLDERVYTAIQ